VRIQQRRWGEAGGWTEETGSPDAAANLVIVFAARSLLSRPSLLQEIREAHPRAQVMGCSTAGEICGTRVWDDSVVLTSVRFEKTSIKSARIDLDQEPDSFAVGRLLAERLASEGLVHLLVFADGTNVNGTRLTQGMVSALPKDVAVTGGLAGDGDRFERTLVIAGEPRERCVAAIGFYGEHLRVGFGSMGGWAPFGPRRLITRSDGNVLYELDRQPALALYKSYLGEHARGLPATGLLFPLSIQMPGSERELVRTILAVDEEHQRMTFAGDIPEGGYAQLMRASFQNLVDGARSAASASHLPLGSRSPELAILISCVGRKLVLKQRTEEEVEAVREVIGPRAMMTGFYSYGEICPTVPDAGCELHNQTMTITTLLEV
jgi:hypothetical protein